MRKIGIYVFFIVTGLILTSCGNNQGDIQRVGMITENQIDEQPWEKKAFEGLQQIEEKYGVDVFLEEDIKTDQEVNRTVDDMVGRGVNLIFGNSNSYGKAFTELTKAYKNVHFVYFDGTYTNKRVSSISFQPHAMSFFAGMIAAKMTTSNEVGIIAAYEWQGEIEGFFEGVKYQNPLVNVQINFIKNKSDAGYALEVYDDMLRDNVDVFYPAGDSFSAKIIEAASKDNVYAIGYLEDQSKIAPSTVLTSTIQDIADVYVRAADQLNKGELDGGVIRYDFEDDVVKLGDFNDAIPKDYQQKIEQAVNEYVESGSLPYEK